MSALKGCGLLCTDSLECPYPVCLQELHGNGTTLHNAVAKEQALRLWSTSAATYQEIASQVGVSGHTVWRWVNERGAV